jgi:FkbM family methyltransferase
MQPLRVPELLVDAALDAVRVRRGPLPAALKSRVIRTRAALGRRMLKQRNGERTCRILDYDVFTYSEATLAFLFRETFVDLDYYFEARSDTPTILDCGSNIGMSILFFKALYPKATIVGFEPGSATFAALEKNVQANRLQDVTLHRAAVGGEDKPVSFFETSAAGSLTASVEPERGTEGQTVVDQVRLSRFIDRRIDLLKLDVEGAEFAVLSDLIASNTLAMIDQMIIEYHHHIRASEDKLARFLSMLETNGYGYQLRAFHGSRGTRARFQDIWIHAYRK